MSHLLDTIVVLHSYPNLQPQTFRCPLLLHGAHQGVHTSASIKGTKTLPGGRKDSENVHSFMYSLRNE